MAKKSLIRRNAKRLKLSNNQKIKRDNLKKIIKNNSLSFSERLIAQTKLSELARDGSKIRYRNRCALSGRPRGNLRKFGLSRIAVRELASWGQIPGLIKSSW
ncbi:MAG: 30S ribosomal protein S14 [Proteobacteria bacterium]|jgi:small subunit ribosomal protein S14|nr:30S ribosomal protein S14 [Pseudomonadota bacterium]NCA27766.1 30S ribosomal protein S14 [Pseudomonadota bacterium]